MSNAIVVPDTFKGPVASVFAPALNEGGDLSGGVHGGYGLIKYRGKVWSVQYQGGSNVLMREDGDGPRGSIDVVIVKANAMLSKTWYEGGWDENNNNPPDCASANGIVPDQGVPKKQSDVCLACPRNAWGSAPNGGKGKACGDHRRMAAVPLADLKNELYGGPLLLRCPAASLQDLAAFEARYKSLGYPYFTMAIKIGFDAQESFPKFTFAAIRPLTEPEGAIVMEHRNSAETARVINEGTAPVQAAASVAAQQGAFLEKPPENAIQPQQVVVRPAAVAEPAGAQPQSNGGGVQPVATAAGNAEPVRTGTDNADARPNGSAGGFGPVATVPSEPVRPAANATQATAGGFGAAAPQPNPAGTSGQPAQAQSATTPTTPAQAAVRPAQQMTGFGPVAAEPSTQPAQAAPATNGAAPPVDPAVTTAFEGSIDQRLNALLAGT